MTTEIKYHTKKEALTAINEQVGNLKFCPPELQDDKEVVMTAVKQNSPSFYHASDELKSSKAFIMNALNEGVEPLGVIFYANIVIQSDIEVITLVLEKSHDGRLFCYAQGEAALNKELAAKAIVKWGKFYGSKDFGLWDRLHPTLQEFFPKDSWYEKSQSYLIQLEQEKQAEMVSGGCKDEDGVVW